MIIMIMMMMIILLLSLITGCPQAMRQTESLCSRCGGTERKCIEKDGVRDGLAGPARN